MILVVDLCQHPLSRSEFVEPIATIVGEEARVVPYDRLSDADVEGARAAIICGTALADDGYLDHLDRFDWLRDPTGPVLGICAGMQLIAVHHGGRLVEGKEIGMVPVRPVEDNPLVPGPIEVYGLHRYDLEGLEAFRVLARSEHCVEAIAHKDLPLYGILFHPEVRRGGVVTRFLDMVGAGTGPS